MTDTQTTQNQNPTDGFAAMFEASEANAGGIEIGGEGQIVTGIVVAVNRDAVVVDIGGKSEGVIKADEFVDATGQLAVAAGDKVDVTGNLTLHGVTKSITFPAKVNVTPDAVDVDAEFSINRKDFGVSFPGMKDDLIRDDVVIKLEIRGKKSQA